MALLSWLEGDPLRREPGGPVALNGAALGFGISTFSPIQGMPFSGKFATIVG